MIFSVKVKDNQVLYTMDKNTDPDEKEDVEFILKSHGGKYLNYKQVYDQENITYEFPDRHSALSAASELKDEYNVRN